MFETGRMIGVYEIVGPLGVGGMGEVYRARDTRLGRMVAIKVVSAELAADAGAVGRLAREARLTSSLNHPNIVTVHDVGEADGRPYIVMELVDGQSLHERIRAAPVKVPKAVDIACQVADGLAAAHGAGIVHRDLKPRNIMVTGDGRAKIVDFGLGKTALRASAVDETTACAPDLTGEHVIVGTAGYMAPEQVTGRPPDYRSDQFALGAVLYEMLTGQRAFKRDTSVQTMAAIVDTEPEPVATLCPAAPPELVTIVERCLAKEPANRYDSTRDLARDLHDVGTMLTLGSRSGHSSRPTPPPRPRVGTPWRIVAVAAVVMAMVAAVVWALRPAPLDQARRLLVRHDRRVNVEQAIALLTEAAARRPDDPAVLVTQAEAYVRLADRMLTPDGSLRQTHLDRAAELCRAAQSADDDRAEVHVVWAMINSASGRHDGAVSEAERAVAVDPRSARAWQELGLARQAVQQWPAAEAALKTAVALAPDDWWGRHLLGRLYLATARWQEGAAEYEQAYALAPDSVRVLNNLASAYFNLDQLDKARGLYQQSLSVEATPTAYNNLGTVLYEQGRFDEAAIQFEQAIATGESTLVLWQSLAAACHWVPRLKDCERHAHEQAVAAAEAELRVAPTEMVKASLADAYAGLGRKAEADRMIAELTRKPIESSVALYKLATIYEQWGERDKALEYLDLAVKAGYNIPRIERSPFLQDLRSDGRYARVIRQR